MIRHPVAGTMPPITRVSEYRGEATVRLSATQLGDTYTTHQARKVVDEWCEFFSSGPSPIQDLAFLTRTPKRLFTSLLGQAQLKSLRVKWGDYDHLAALVEMGSLEEAFLGGATSLRSTAGIERLHAVKILAIESLRHVRDLSEVGELSSLRELELGGDWMNGRVTKIASIDFLRRLPDLEELTLHTIIVEDLDYSPLLQLSKLRKLAVKSVAGMVPTVADLRAQVPFLETLS